MFLKAAKRQDVFKFIRCIMYCAGMHSFNLEQHLPHFLNGLAIFLELLLELFLYFVAIHIWILYICTIYVNYNSADLELFVNCLIQTIIYWWVITIKIYFRCLRKNQLENLIDLINFNYYTHSAVGLTYVTTDSCLAMCNKWVKCFICCCFMGTLFWLCLPVAYGDRSLPLDCWYPFDYKQPIVYEFMYFLQFVGQIQAAAAFSASSGFYMVLAILLSGQYDILYCSLKNIFATVAIKSGTARNDLGKLYKLQKLIAPEANEYYCSKEIRCEMDFLIQQTRKANSQNFRFHFRNAIKKCIDHHCFIMKCLSTMEDFYCPIWFLKMGEVLFLACLVAFVSVKSTTANSTFIKILSLGEYLLLITWELLIICYFGETVYVNSQRCGEAILRSPWYLHMPDIKLDLLLFLLNSKRPFKLTAGKILTLNTELFKSMITTGFSFLTLLQKMDNRDE